MKIRKKTLDAIHSILTEWHGEEGAANSLVEFHPQPLAIDSLVDKIVARAVPPWERRLNEIKQLCEGVLYIEIFHPAYRMALDTPKIRGMILEKAVSVLGAANCRELKFIPAGRSGPVVQPVRRRTPSSGIAAEKKKPCTPDLPL